MEQKLKREAFDRYSAVQYNRQLGFQRCGSVTHVTGALSCLGKAG